MSANSRLTLAVHTLTLIARYEGSEEHMTSERISRSVQANPVVLRGLLGLMEKQGLVRVQRGSNAGWRLSRPADQITLLSVYRAVKPDKLFSLHHTPPNPDCIVGCGIGPALEDVYADVQGAVDQQLAGITIADMLRSSLDRSSAIQAQRAENIT